MSPQIIVFLVPIVAIMAGVAFAITRVLVGHRQRLQRTELRHKERMAAIEKGLELPPDPPESDPLTSAERFAAVDGPRLLRQGLVLIAIGVAATAGMMQLPGGDVPYLFWLVPAAIGMAYLLSYFIQRRHQQPRADGAAAAGPRPGAA